MDYPPSFTPNWMVSWEWRTFSKSYLNSLVFLISFRKILVIQKTVLHQQDVIRKEIQCTCLWDKTRKKDPISASQIRYKRPCRPQFNWWTWETITHGNTLNLYTFILFHSYPLHSLLYLRKFRIQLRKVTVLCIVLGSLSLSLFSCLSFLKGEKERNGRTGMHDCPSFLLSFLLSTHLPA